MKTRIIHTKIHFEDDWFNTLSIGYRYLYIYLFTNSHIGLTGIYKLSKRVALLETGATNEDWDNACKMFSEANKVLFYKDWIYIVNSKRYANYTGPKNEEAVKKECSNMPIDIKTKFGYCIDTVSYTIDTPINHKSEIINKKPEIINQGDGYKMFLETRKKLVKTMP